MTSAARLVSRTLTVGLLCSGLALTACGKSTESASTTTSSTSSSTASGALDPALRAHGWVLDPSDSSIDVGDGHVVNLRFADETDAVGSAGCNTYRAAVTVSGATGLRFGEPITTRKACAAPVMATETAYLAALEKVTTAELEDPGRLVLTGSDDVRLAFTAADADSELTGTWTITSYRTTDALVSPLEGTDVTITFADDDSVQVTTGCNGVGATVERDGDHIRFTEGRRTLMACEDPPGVMDQEQALADALEATRSLEQTGTSLNLLDADGKMTIVAVKE